MPEISDRRLPGWKRHHDSFSGREAARYMQLLRADLKLAGPLLYGAMLVPPTPSTKLFGIEQAGGEVGFVRGLASGQALFPDKHFRVQEEFPQLVRVLGSTHEAFHHIEGSLGIVKKMAINKFPEERAQLEPLSTKGGLANTVLIDQLPHDCKFFLLHNAEVFADVAAVVNLLNYAKDPKDPQIRQFLGEWMSFRSEMVMKRGDIQHKSGNTIKAVLDAYDQA